MSEPNKPTTVPSVDDIVHTPGPWIVSPYAKNLVATADDKIGIADVAMCGPWIAKPPQEQQDANAILMSAAPDLLAACKSFLDMWHRAGPLGSNQFEKFDGVVRQCSIAVHKASGKVV